MRPYYQDDHVPRVHVCLGDGCACWRYVPLKPTAQGVHAPGGGEALPSQGQSEGTP